MRACVTRMPLRFPHAMKLMRFGHTVPGGFPVIASTGVSSISSMLLAWRGMHSVNKATRAQRSLCQASGSARLAVVGDVHDRWSARDAAALQALSAVSRNSRCRPNVTACWCNCSTKRCKSLPLTLYCHCCCCCCHHCCCCHM